MSAACSAQLLFFISYILSFFLSFFIILYKLWDLSPSSIFHLETPFKFLNIQNSLESRVSLQILKIFYTFWDILLLKYYLFYNMGVNGRTAEPTSGTSNCLRRRNKCSTVYLRSNHLTNLHTLIFNNIETEFRYHLNFVQNHTFSFIPLRFQLFSLKTSAHSDTPTSYNIVVTQSFFNRLSSFKPLNKSTHLYLQ